MFYFSLLSVRAGPMKSTETSTTEPTTSIPAGIIRLPPKRGQERTPMFPGVSGSFQ